MVFGQQLKQREAISSHRRFLSVRNKLAGRGKVSLRLGEMIDKYAILGEAKDAAERKVAKLFCCGWCFLLFLLLLLHRRRLCARDARLGHPPPLPRVGHIINLAVFSRALGCGFRGETRPRSMET